MTGGKHITGQDCREMRRDARRGRTYDHIADDMDVNPKTVWYHVRGHCSHQVDVDPTGVDSDD